MYSSKRAWIRRACLLALIAVPLTFHQQLLALAASVVVADEGTDGCNTVMLLGANGLRCSVAADLWSHDAVEKVLVVEGRKWRIVESGIVPPESAVAVPLLQRFGVPAAAIVVLDGLTYDEWEIADKLKTWLENHPEASVVVLEERFKTRRLRFILDESLVEDMAKRVKVAVVSEHRYDESNWWRKRAGVRSLVNESIKLIYVWGNGKPAGYAGDHWDPDVFEQELRLGA